MSDFGYIALGKYSSARDSILDYLTSVGWGNDSFGDVEAPTGYVSRISNDWEEVKPENGEFTSIMGDWFEANPEVTDSPELRRELVGHFIVNEDSNGFVYVVQFDTEQAMHVRYNALEREYDEWFGDGED